MTSQNDDGEDRQTEEIDEVTEVGSRREIRVFLDTLPPPPEEDTIPG